MVASFRYRITNTHPKCRRSIDSEADIKPTCPQGLIARARELEKVVAQHADRTEGHRDEDCEHRFSHRRLATCKSDSPFTASKQVTVEKNQTTQPLSNLSVSVFSDSSTSQRLNKLLISSHEKRKDAADSNIPVIRNP